MIADSSNCHPKVLFNRAYDYYQSISKFTYTEEDKEKCWGWVEAALCYNNGNFDPRNNHIVSPEQHFDLVIPYNWAKYIFWLGSEKLEGQLSIKGTMDLLQKIDDDTYEIVDYKTGARKDWNTGKEKDLTYLTNKDAQLRLYYYAARKLYPEIKNLLVTIFFLNTGGPFTIVFDDNTMLETEQYLKEKFIDIKSSFIPRRTIRFDKWRLNCNWCEHYKNKDHVTDKNVCDTVHESILKNGIAKTTEKYIQNKKNLFDYGTGGGRQNE